MNVPCPFCNADVIVPDHPFDLLGEVVHTCEGGTWNLAYESSDIDSDLSYFYLEKQ